MGRHEHVPRGTSFADAKPPEQRIEHILDAGAPGDPVEHPGSKSQALGNKDQVAGLARPRVYAKPLLRFGKCGALTLAQRRFAFAGQQRSRHIDNHAMQRFHPFTRRRRQDQVAARSIGLGSSIAAPVIGLRRNQDAAGMVGGVTRRAEPQDDVCGLHRGARAVDTDRFDNIGTFAAQSRGV